MENKTIEVNNQNDTANNQELIIEEPFILKYDNRLDAGRGTMISIVSILLLPFLGSIAISINYGFLIFLIIIVVTACGINMSKKGLMSSARGTAIGGIIIGIIVEIISCGILLLICIIKILDFIMY